MEYGKCGPLCQHPACWYVGENIANITKKHPRFQQYVEFLSSKRSTQEREPPPPSGELTGVRAACSKCDLEQSNVD